MAILAPGTSPASGRVTNDDNTVIGDLVMTVDFASGATNPITATANNFAGTVGGTAVTVGGELTTAAHIANATGTPNNTVATSTSPNPLGGTITATQVSATLSGTLTDTSGVSGLAGDVNASILAPTSGPVPTGASLASDDPRAIRGPFSVSIQPNGGALATTTGTFVVTR